MVWLLLGKGRAWKNGFVYIVLLDDLKTSQYLIAHGLIFCHNDIENKKII